jgi:hypothetical protein
MKDKPKVLRQDSPVSSVPKEYEDALLATPRLRREQRTIAAMLRIWCRAHQLHIRPRGEALCAGCDDLLDYASYRLVRCPYGEEKPTCRKCPIHCYSRNMRELMREVMQFAGPRMILRHPILAFHHLHDGRRVAPPMRRVPRSLGTN